MGPHPAPGTAARREKPTPEVCAFPGVGREPGMLDHGRHYQGRFVPNLGDRSDNIKSGQVQAARTFDGIAGLPPRLAKYATAWGYV
ncbi:hypothetical protein [Nonomuraea sp. GTA35]|uniref:hypothetical protein n=1 Tax=Nonomuraea sp. GTA35 TaxID=1676746 RepID=UPI0035C15304